MLDTMAKNYSHCPLKKRPVQIFEEISDEPENLSTKPEDLSRRLTSVSPSSLSVTPPISPSSVKTSPSPSPPPHFYLKPEPHLTYPAPISPEYVPETWHNSVAPMYPPAYPFVHYRYHHHEYMGMSPTYRDSSLSPPHHVQHPLQPLAMRPIYSSIDQSSLSPSSSSASPPPPRNPAAAEDLSEKRRQGVRHQCPDCCKSYSTFSGLSKHRQFHCAAGDGPKKSFNCKVCEKVYVSLGALKMHIRTHTLPCKCTICGKAFSRPWLLQGHIRTHTGEKPFSCTYCNRAFADRSNLRAHLQTHSDVKKYSCASCSKTFSRMSLLTKHAEGGCSGGGVLHPEKLY